MTTIQELYQVQQKLTEIYTLISENEYEKYLRYHLIIAEIEVKRQLTNHKHSIKIKE